MHDEPLTLADAVQQVYESLAADPAASQAKLKEITRMATSLQHRGAFLVDDVTDDLVFEYLHEVTFWHGEPRDPSASKVRTRRWAVREFFAAARQLGLTNMAIGIDLDTPGRPALLTRPLEDSEMLACENAAKMTLFETREPAVLALAQAGSDIREIAGVRVGDIDLIMGTVRLGGRHGRPARVNALTEWGSEAVASRIAKLAQQEPDTPLVVLPGTVAASATASISGTLGDILKRAHLGVDPTTKPRSVRAWSGRRVWTDTHDIIVVARWLGATSLDTAAATIGLDWIGT